MLNNNLEVMNKKDKDNYLLCLWVYIVRSVFIHNWAIVWYDNILIFNFYKFYYYCSLIIYYYVINFWYFC